MQIATRPKEQRVTIDSGATSHFITEEMNLPKMGPSNKTIYLPDSATLTASEKNNVSIQQTLKQSTKDRHTPRTQTTPDEHEQNGKGRLHNGFPPRQRRGHSAQTWDI